MSVSYFCYQEMLLPVMDWIDPAKVHLSKSQVPVSQEVMVFGDRACKGVTKLEWGF